MKTALILAAVALAGCAVPTTGVVARPEGMFTITRQGNGAWVQPMELTSAATQDAAAYCASVKQKAKIIHTKEIPAGAFGRWPESEVLFRCE